MIQLEFLIGLFAGVVLGVFAWSNILLPMFSSWPLAIKLRRQGRLARPIPVINFVGAPLVWSL